MTEWLVCAYTFIPTVSVLTNKFVQSNYETQVMKKWKAMPWKPSRNRDKICNSVSWEGIVVLNVSQSGQYHWLSLLWFFVIDFMSREVFPPSPSVQSLSSWIETSARCKLPHLIPLSLETTILPLVLNVIEPKVLLWFPLSRVNPSLFFCCPLIFVIDHKCLPWCKNLH